MALRDVAVVGVYATEQARRLPGRTSFDLSLESVLGALDDAGLAPGDVDGAAVDWPGPGGAVLAGGYTYPTGVHSIGDAASWATLLGGPFAWMSDGFNDCAGPKAIIKAASAISSGLCEVVVIGGGAAGGEIESRFAGGVHSTDNEFNEPWGTYIPAQLALMAQRHMYEFGTKPEHLAEVAATIRNHGHVNPEAVMYGRGPYTIDDILASRMIASPLHLLDICLIAQGGAAVVLTTLDRAADLKHPPIVVIGAGMEFPQGQYQNPPAYGTIGRAGSLAARRAYAMAGIGPDDIDVYCLYDMTSFEVIRQFEVLGVCAEGEGGPFVEGGTIALGGQHPTNPDGGILSYAWSQSQQMTLKVVECVKQLRGDAGDRQVPGAEIAVACGPGGANTHFAMTLFARA